MSGRRRFYLVPAVRRSNSSAVAIEQADADVFVKTQPGGEFFLERLGSRLGHDGIKRRNASVQPCHAKRFASERLHPKSFEPLRSCSFSEARGRGHRVRRA